MNNGTGNKRIRLGMWMAVAALALLSLGMGIYLSMTTRKDHAEVAPEKPFPVTTLVITARAMTNVVVVPGRVEAAARVRLTAETGGRVVEILADKGQVVAEKQLLLRLDSRHAEYSLRQAEAQEREARRQMERAMQLRPAGAISDSDYERYTNSWDTAAALLGHAKVAVTQCEVLSPIAGTVNNRIPEIGEYVKSGDEVFDIVQISEIKVQFSVPEREIANVAAQGEMKFTIEAIPGREYSGKVSFVAVASERDMSSYKAELTAPNPDVLMRPGMLARVFLTCNTMKDVLIIPLAGVIPDKGDHVVYVVENGRAARRVVQLDAIQGNEVVIRSGLKSGDVVAVDGARGLTDGAMVVESK